MLDLNNIKFELVPAYKKFGTYYIPNGNGGWMATYPNDFNRNLTETNNNNSYKIKPIVRLIKHWNVNINYRGLTSYKIEECIADTMKYAFYTCTSYAEYVKYAFNELKNLTYNINILNRINRAIERIDKAVEYERYGMYDYALSEIKKVFPEV